jgi:hypothetical protein
LLTLDKGMADFTQNLPAQTGSFSSQFQFVQPDPLWFRKPKPTPQELAAALAPEVAEEKKEAAPSPLHEGNRMADEYIAAVLRNPAMANMVPMPAMPGFNPQQALANSVPQQDGSLQHPDYKGPGWGEWQRVLDARAQADANAYAASRI